MVKKNEAVISGNVLQRLQQFSTLWIKNLNFAQNVMSKFGRTGNLVQSLSLFLFLCVLKLKEE